MLCLDVGAMEQCAPDKGMLRPVCPDAAWIHYVLSGSGFCNGILLGRGEGFIFYRNERCEYAPNPSDPWKYVWIRLTGEDTEGLWERSGLPRQSGIFRFSYAERLTTLAQALPGAAEGGTLAYREAAAKMILSLYDGEACESGRGNPWVERAKSYIALHYHERLRIERLAEQLHIDRKYLRNLFVRYTGRSTSAYLRDYRMEKAKALLTAPDITVSEVAVSVGYDDPLAFSKAFRAHVGLSPTAFRAERRRM